jgi:hypothetical protein
MIFLTLLMLATLKTNAPYFGGPLADSHITEQSLGSSIVSGD